MTREPLSTVHPDWWQPDPVSWPHDWRSRFDAWIERDAQADEVTIWWSEGRDDHYGTTERSVTVPGAVLRAALACVTP